MYGGVQEQRESLFVGDACYVNNDRVVGGEANLIVFERDGRQDSGSTLELTALNSMEVGVPVGKARESGDGRLFVLEYFGGRGLVLACAEGGVAEAVSIYVVEIDEEAVRVGTHDSEAGVSVEAVYDRKTGRLEGISVEVSLMEDNQCGEMELEALIGVGSKVQVAATFSVFGGEEDVMQIEEEWLYNQEDERDGIIKLTVEKGPVIFIGQDEDGLWMEVVKVGFVSEAYGKVTIPQELNVDGFVASAEAIRDSEVLDYKQVRGLVRANEAVIEGKW